MLDPDVVLNSVVATLQSIPELVAELGAPAIPATDSITGHFYFSGEETSLVRDLSQMLAPSIKVMYLDYIMGNYDAQTMWKHRLNIAIRSRNRAAEIGAASAPHIWWMCMNLPVNAPMEAPNIRSIDLVNGLLWLYETNLKYQQDELGQDFLIGTMVWNEIGDAGPDGVNQLCLGPSIAGFADAIMNHLSAAERQTLIRALEKRGEAN